MFEHVAAERAQAGAVLGPFDAFLLLRGLRTLHLRHAAAEAGALAVVELLEGHPAVTQVLHPAAAGHPTGHVARRQMDGLGSLLSFRLGDAAAARRVAGRLRLIRRATSLGGVESLLEHRASVEPPSSPVPDDLLRLSVGVEDPADLLADLRQALDA